MAMQKGSSLTDEEAKALHGNVVSVTILFVAIAVVAHILMWMWKPWIVVSKSAALDAAGTVVSTLIG